MNAPGNDTLIEDDPLPRRAKPADYAWAVAACLGTTLLAAPLHDRLDLSNIVMLFLLTVVLVAVRFGRGPAVVAAFLGVASFDFFFVPPRFSFAVSDVQYVLTFAVMLVVALVTGHLTARLRAQALAASEREGRTRALYGMARDLSGALTAEQAVDIACRFVEDGLAARVAVFLPMSDGGLKAVSVPKDGAGDMAEPLARVAFERGEPVGPGMSAPDKLVLYLPLKAPMRVRGVMAIALNGPGTQLSPEQRQHLDTVASLVAIVLERLHYVDVAQEALLKVESERLRNSLLAALSHDLRTPLTALVGLSDSLALPGQPLPPRQRETAEAIRDEALRMNSLVGNLLDMARLQAGPLRLRKEWQPLEEVVGSSLKSLGARLANHAVTTALAADLPLLEFDAVLIERVLCNLVENAAKYAPPGSEVVIGARRLENEVEVDVSDNGPGLAPGSESAIFEKFMRGQPESATPGVGLGLAICRSIVEAHGGRIRAENRPEGGARFVFTLPTGTPPAIDAALLEKLEGEIP
jgi:two-component system sensor histidine kinase KdpD